MVLKVRRRTLLQGIAVGVTLFLVGSVYLVLTWPDVAVLAHAAPRSTAFIDRYRERQREAGQSDAIVWQWVPWEAISPHLKRAVVSAEDMEFFSHSGFSTTEMRTAIRETLQEGKDLRGASTISQQLAKNLWLSPSRNPLRKFKEALLTWQLEQRLSKRRILELYLNVVEFGHGVYGAEAAAQHYFGRSATSLTEIESAQLAAGLPRPGSWHPGVESPYYRRYVEDILGRMHRATFLWGAIGVDSAEAPTNDVSESKSDSG